MLPTMLPSISRRRFVLGVSALLAPTIGLAAERRLIVGTYPAERFAMIQRLTLPRVHLYDHEGKLVGRDAWPAEMAAIKAHAGEAFCCVSDKPVKPGSKEPPEDCKVIVYGEDIREHFDRLRTASGAPVRYQDLPRHRYLIVDYYADWCAPCIPGRRTLEAFLQSPAGAGYVAVVVDFSDLPKMPKRPASAGKKS